MKHSVKARRKAIAIALAAIILIMIPLSLTSYALVVNNTIKARIYSLSQEWLAGSNYRLVAVNTETADHTVGLVILGEGDLPPLDLLEEQVRGQTFGRPLRVETIQSSSYILHADQ